MVSIVNEPEVAAARIEREGEQFVWSDCSRGALIYEPGDSYPIEISHRKDFSVRGNHLDVVSFSVEGDALRKLTLGQQEPIMRICGDEYPLNTMHQRSISEFIDAWNGIIVR